MKENQTEQWEYTTITIEREKESDALLNAYGRLGWQAWDVERNPLHSIIHLKRRAQKGGAR